MNKRKKTFRKLDSTISRLTRKVESGGSELVRDERVQSALRELKKSRKGGQVNLDRIVEALSLISEAACDKFLNNDDQGRK